MPPLEWLGTEDMDEAIDPENYLDAVAPVIGLAIPIEYRAGVLANLRVIFAQCRLIDEVPLDAADESAAIFRP
jgi:hypothetical protein